MLFYLSSAAECFCLPAERGVMDLGSISLVFHWCLSFSSPTVMGFPPVASGHRFDCCPLKSQAFLPPGDREGAMWSVSPHCCFFPEANPTGESFSRLSLWASLPALGGVPGAGGASTSVWSFRFQQFSGFHFYTSPCWAFSSSLNILTLIFLPNSVM